MLNWREEGTENKLPDFPGKGGDVLGNSKYGTDCKMKCLK